MKYVLVKLKNTIGNRRNIEPLSTYEAKLKTWDKADCAASQIVKTLAKVMMLLVTCECAKDMWFKLHAVFEQQTKQAAHTA